MTVQDLLTFKSSWIEACANPARRRELAGDLVDFFGAGTGWISPKADPSLIQAVVKALALFKQGGSSARVALRDRVFAMPKLGWLRDLVEAATSDSAPVPSALNPAPRAAAPVVRPPEQAVATVQVQGPRAAPPVPADLVLPRRVGENGRPLPRPTPPGSAQASSRTTSTSHRSSTGTTRGADGRYAARHTRTES